VIVEATHTPFKYELVDIDLIYPLPISINERSSDTDRFERERVRTSVSAEPN